MNRNFCYVSLSVMLFCNVCLGVESQIAYSIDAMDGRVFSIAEEALDFHGAKKACQNHGQELAVVRIKNEFIALAIRQLMSIIDGKRVPHRIHHQGKI